MWYFDIMIEILILYIINNREKTIYSIRKDIIELFGTFTKPSLGTIHPALKRMLLNKYVQVSDRMSEGGKKSSYYSITDIGRKYFKELFFSDISENPSLFYNQLQSRFATLGMLTAEEKNMFLEETIKKIELFKFDIDNKLKDEFISLDFYQHELLKKMLLETASLKEFVYILKANDERKN